MKNEQGNTIHLRRCVSCGKRFEKNTLIRVTIHGETVSLDSNRQGRGAYVCREKECLTAAANAKKNVFARAFKRKVDSAVYEQIRILSETVQENNGKI